MSIIEKSGLIEELIGAVEVPSSNCWSWSSVHYHVIGADLRQPVSLLKALGYAKKNEILHETAACSVCNLNLTVSLIEFALQLCRSRRWWCTNFYIG